MGESKLVLTKKQIFLAGTVCLMIVLLLVDAARALQELSKGRNEFMPLNNVLFLFNVLPAVLVLLKLLLPAWQPHKKWLAWLLGAAIAGRMLNPIYDFIMGLVYRADLLVTIGYFAGFVVLNILVASNVQLLRGLIRKKDTVKIAGVFAVIELGVVVVEGIVVMLRSPSLWAILLSSILVNAGYVILYFNWPVLTRPILEKIPEELVPGQEDQPAAEEV